MEPELQRKIEETVIDILKTSNIEEVTEFNVRVTATERLGIDLSGTDQRKFIRGVVESFLISSIDTDTEEGKEANGTLHEELTEAAQEDLEAVANKEVDGDGNNRVICKLSEKRNVTVPEFKGKSFVSIRDFYLKDGKLLPSKAGICLTTEQWSAIKQNVPAIEEAITRMKSNLRSQKCKSKADVEQNGVTMKPAAVSPPEELRSQKCKPIAAVEQNGITMKPVAVSPPEELRSQKCKSKADVEQNGITMKPVAASPPEELISFEVNRFDGKNYQGWALQMESFLKQLKIAYVLSDPCPCVNTHPQASAEEIAHAKAAEQRWLNDDYLCRHNILNSLSDSLYYQYLKKTKSAQELWAELKFVYLHEELGPKRSHVKKYLEFQMVDEKSIVDQVQELNGIADTIVAAGMFVDANFHVSAVISKLPSSWKDFCMKLMHEEHLPFWTFMDRVRIEEESRNRDKTGEPSSHAYSRHDKYLGPRMREMKKPGLHWKRRELEIHNKSACYICGKEGHFSKHCHDRKVDKGTSEKRDKENSICTRSFRCEIEHRNRPM